MSKYYLTHSPIDFVFNQSAKDFVVTEVPLYDFSGEGEHLVFKLAKKGLSTWEALQSISSSCHIPIRELGYAGLKDKQAYTIQHISVHKKYEPNLEHLSDERLKIVERCYHKNKLKTGHLKGNKFFIRVKKLNPVDAKKIESAVETIREYGFPNFFGFQRFGKDGDNAEKGKELAHKIKGRVNYKNEFFINAYQSQLFNTWLEKRIAISNIVTAFDKKEAMKALGFDEAVVNLLQSQKHPFKLLGGEIFCHYPHGRLFSDENTLEQSERFLQKEIAPTGLLYGKKSEFAEGLAGEIESAFVDTAIGLNGVRRYAWVWPEELTFTYKEEDAHGEFSFFLPKGCYATTLLEQIKGAEIVPAPQV